MVLRQYRCSQCLYLGTEKQRISDPLLTVCPSCSAPSYKRHYTQGEVPTVHFAGGPPSQVASAGFVGGDRPFRRPFVGRERNGNDTVYTSEVQMARAEYDRAQGNKVLSPRGRSRFAHKQVADARRLHGLRPGTVAAQQAQVAESQPSSGWSPAEG